VTDHFRAFVGALHHRPDAKITVAALYRAYRETLPERERDLWPRWHFVRCLEAAGLTLGHDSSRTLCVAGVSLEPAPAWTRTESGRLVKQ
jgi:hypothetical protein